MRVESKIGAQCVMEPSRCMTVAVATSRLGIPEDHSTINWNEEILIGPLPPSGTSYDRDLRGGSRC